MIYCLDTNFIIDIFNGVEDVRPKIDSLKGESLLIPTIVLCELYKGAYLSTNKEHGISMINSLLNESQIIELDNVSCRLFGELNAILSKKGRLTEENDLMIAAICISHNATLVTRNKKHFQNIPGLKVEYC